MNQKNLLLIILLFGLILSLVACSNSSAATGYFNLTATPTSSIPPTATLVSYSSTQTTPVIFIPMGTFTPAPAAICPNVNNSVATLKIDNVLENFEQSYEEPILNFLNAGGSVAILHQELQNLMHWFNVSTVDLTNDTVPEVIVEANSIYIFGCSNGEYHSLLIVDPILSIGYSPGLRVKDMNLDGIPELVVSRTYGGQTPMLQVNVLEWDNDQFRSLLAKDNVCSRNSYVACVWNGVPDIMGGNVELVDMDNGTTKLMITGGVEIGSPRKPVTFVWVWNGNEFILSRIDLPSS